MSAGGWARKTPPPKSTSPPLSVHSLTRSASRRSRRAPPAVGQFQSTRTPNASANGVGATSVLTRLLPVDPVTLRVNPVTQFRVFFASARWLGAVVGRRAPRPRPPWAALTSRSASVAVASQLPPARQRQQLQLRQPSSPLPLLPHQPHHPQQRRGAVGLPLLLALFRHRASALLPLAAQASIPTAAAAAAF
jgi:hypothetical protein